ncbi:hypothetical protein MRX96_039666 [Rhipicephalus microplus]
MSANASCTAEAIALASKLLSQISINDKTEEIQRIVSLSPEARLSSSDAVRFDALVLRCPPEDLLLVLTSALHRFDKSSFRRDKVVSLLDKFVRGDYLRRLLVGQCHRNVACYSEEWSRSACTVLLSLPERVANVRGQSIPNCLTRNGYFVSLFDGIFEALSHARDELDRGVDVHVDFFSRLLGRMCPVGQSELLARHLVPKLVRRCESDFIFRRVCAKVVTSVRDDCPESISVVLLSALRDYRQVDWFFTDSVCTDSRFRFFLAKKLPLAQTYSSTMLLQNLIGYLASSERRRPIFYELLSGVFDCWGDKAMMKYQSEQEQKYLTSALMISVGHLKASGIDGTTADGLLPKLLHGVQSHLSSPDEWVRLYGMVTAEQFTPILHPDGPKLKFEYKPNDDIKYLLSLTDISVKSPDPDDASMTEPVSIEEEKEKTKSPKIVATYLTEQFYGVHLNIRQRLDILEVLALASNQLASPTTTVHPVTERTVSTMASSHWNSVVTERLKAKTRIISKGATAVATPTENRFSDVAGFFFYPLMRYYDRKENTFDLLGEDSFVLTRLIYTLGIVQDSAANCPKSVHMAHCFMEFLSALKYHAEACVRDAVLFALSVILITVPIGLLLSNDEQELVEIREWLQYVIERDPSDVCKLKAAQVLQLLCSQVNKELPVPDK